MAKRTFPLTTAREIMSTDLVNATAGMTVEEVLKVLINHRVTGLPVVDERGRMKGVISEYDLLAQIAGSEEKKEDAFRQKIKFSKKVDAVREETPLAEIVREFIDTRYRRLPVVDADGRLVGIITRRDLMRVYYYRAKLAGSVE